MNTRSAAWGRAAVLGVLLMLLLTPGAVYADYIEIDSLAELQKIGNDGAYPLNGDYVLTTDLDAAGVTGFAPIGTYSGELTDAFAGTFDGQGHIIRNLSISAGEGTGLFGASTGIVTDLGLIGCTLTGTQKTGGMAGVNSGEIGRCYVKNGVVTGTGSVGGFVGMNVGTIYECFAHVTVSAESSGGGFAGFNSNLLHNCYSTGPVTGTSALGGFLGTATAGGWSVNCYSSGAVSKLATTFGGFIGEGESFVVQCFWDTETSGCSTSIGGTGLTSAEMTKAIYFTNAAWEFTTTWSILENDAPPHLQHACPPIGIGSATDLQAIGSANFPADFDYYLTQSFDAAATAGWPETFVPLCPATSFSGAFYGRGYTISNLTVNRAGLDNIGLFAKVSPWGLVKGVRLANCQISGSSNVGAIAGSNSGTLNDCQASGAVAGSVYVGGLVGENRGLTHYCTSSGSVSATLGAGGLVGAMNTSPSSLLSAGISHCASSCEVSSDFYAGGLVGDCRNTSITHSHASGDVVASTSSGGGLVGYLRTGNLQYCYATGTATAAAMAGGLVGNSSTGMMIVCYATGGAAGDVCGGLVGLMSRGEICQCYSLATVTATDSLGGLVGALQSGARIVESFSAGPVSSTAGDRGGLVGYTESTCTVDTSFWDITASGCPESAEGVGYSTAAMKTKATYTDATWDFVDTWGIDEGDGYPYFLPFNPIRVTNPSGGESWYPRTRQTISWTYAPDSGTHVKIKLYKAGVFQQWIAGLTPNDGALDWIVPSNLPLASDYSIRIYSATDFSKIHTGGNFAITTSPIGITSPNGGETWSPNSQHTITWTSSPVVGDTVKIKLWKNGVFNRWISGGAPNTGSFVWKLPADLPIAVKYEIQIYDAAVPSIADFSDDYFATAAPTVNITHPNGAERFTPGDPVAITWTTQPGAGDTVKLKLFKGGAAYTWINAGTPNDGLLDWTFPASLPAGDDYTIQIYTPDLAQVDYSDAAFSMTSNRLRLTAPKGGESWAANTTRNITWSTTGTVGDNVKIKLFKNGVLSQWISGGTANDGSLSWKIPASLVPGADYRVQIYSATDYTIVDNSDRAFSITAPPLLVTAPNGGETWMIGQEQTITWTSNGTAGGNVKIKLFKNGVFNRWIVGSTPDDGSYAWTVPADVPLGVDYKVQIYGATNSAVIDDSDAVFTVAAPGK